MFGSVCLSVHPFAFAVFFCGGGALLNIFNGPEICMLIEIFREHCNLCIMGLID